METLDDIIKKLREIKKRGYIKTHRAGQTGIGKTLEDLLGIEENNIPIANTTFAELKSARKGSGSMITLFTKSPLPSKANTPSHLSAAGNGSAGFAHTGAGRFSEPVAGVLVPRSSSTIDSTRQPFVPHL